MTFITTVKSITESAKSFNISDIRNLNTLLLNAILKT